MSETYDGTQTEEDGDSEASDFQPEAFETDPDAGSEDGDGSGPGDGVSEGLNSPQEAAPLPGRRRASDAIQTLRRENQALREQTARLEGRFTELAQQRSPPSGPTAEQVAAQEAQERAQLELMLPAEVARYYHDKTMRTVQQQMQAQAFNTWDMSDLAAFRSQTATDPLARKYERQVEDLLRSERAAGRNSSRETILNFLIGRDARAKAQAAAGKQGKTAQGRVNGATGRVAPPAQGADARGARERAERDSLEARLRNVTF